MVWGKSWELDVGRYDREGMMCGEGWEGRSVIKITVRFYSAVTLSVQLQSDLLHHTSPAAPEHSWRQ